MRPCGSGADELVAPLPLATLTCCAFGLAIHPHQVAVLAAPPGPGRPSVSTARIVPPDHHVFTAAGAVQTGIVNAAIDHGIDRRCVRRRFAPAGGEH